MKGAADDYAQKSVPLLSPDPYQAEDLRWGMSKENFQKNLCSSMGSCVDAFSSWISSKCLKRKEYNLKADRAGDRSSKFLDDVLDELRWGIKTSIVLTKLVMILDPNCLNRILTFEVGEFNVDFNILGGKI